MLIFTCYVFVLRFYVYILYVGHEPLKHGVLILVGEILRYYHHFSDFSKNATGVGIIMREQIEKWNQMLEIPDRVGGGRHQKRPTSLQALFDRGFGESGAD